MNKISHKNIVRFHGYVTWNNEDENYYGTVIELCDVNLEEFISKAKRKKINLSWSLRHRLFTEIADALVYLHCHNPNRSYIHGDIKPQNILLTENLSIKLADFGSSEIQKAMGVNTISIHIKPNQQHTPLYAAPEFLNDPSRKTCPMDIYRYFFRTIILWVISVLIKIKLLYVFVN